MPDLVPWWNLLPQAPDYNASANALANAQRTQVYVQQAQQQVQAQNALRALYTNPDNYDPQTMQPTQPAMNALMRASPQAAISLGNDLVKLQENRARAQYTQGQINKQYQDQAANIRARSLSAYDDALKTMPPEQALRVGQETYTSELDNWLPNLPPDMRQRVNRQFDPIRMRAANMSAKRQEEVEKGWETRDDYGHMTSDGKPTEYSYNKVTGQSMNLDRSAPYTPSGVGKPEKAEPELYTVEAPDGKGGTREVTARRDPQGGFVDDATNEKVQGATNPRKIGTTQQMGGTTGGVGGNPDVHGADYLKTLQPGVQTQVKALAEGRMQFPSGFALRSPYWQQMLQAVSQYDPSFDAVNYNARAATRKDFTSGKSAQNITSFNTAIGHLGTLEKAAEKLNNSDYPLVNSLKNLVETHIGDPRVKEFDVARQAVSAELERAFRGTGGNVTEIEEWKKAIDSAGSPAQLRGAVRQAVNLLRSRIEAVGEQYRRGMGTSADVMDLLSPEARKTLQSLPGGEDLSADKETAVPGEGKAPQSGAQSSGQSGAAPPPVTQFFSTHPEFKEGMSVQFGNGQVWTIENGQPKRLK